MTAKTMHKLSQDDTEILRRALNGHLIRPNARITLSLIEVLRDHFNRLDKIELTDSQTSCLGYDS